MATHKDADATNAHVEVMKGAVLRDLPITRLEVHPKVQRKFQLARARKLLNEFDPARCTPLMVSEEGLRLLVYEGQHRLWVLPRFLGGDLNGQLISCYVRKNVPHSELAKDRLATDSQAKMSAIDRFNMRLLAEEAQALAIRAVLARYGLTISDTAGAGFIKSPGACDAIAARPSGIKMLDRVFGILSKSFGNKPEAYQGDLVSAIGFLVFKFGATLNDATIIQVLSKGQKGAPGWVAAGKAVSESLGGNAIHGVVRCLLRGYNIGRKPKAKLVWDD